MPMVTFQVSATNSNWQQSPVVLALGETATVTASGKWGVIDPHNRGENGPGGDGVPAHGNYFMTDPAGEGCLVMRDGAGNLYRWAADNDALGVHNPGTLFFACNDDRNPTNGVGFGDNYGSLTVTVNFG